MKVKSIRNGKIDECETLISDSEPSSVINDNDIYSKKRIVLHYIEQLRTNSDTEFVRNQYKQLIGCLRNNDYIPNKTQHGFLIDVNAMSNTALDVVIELKSWYDIECKSS